MQWHYVENGENKGPIDEDQLDRLVQQGVIGDDTYVWNPNMADWAPYGEVRMTPSASQTGEAPHEPFTPTEPDSYDPYAAEVEHPQPGGPGALAPSETPEAHEHQMAFCSECGRRFPADEMLSYGDALICAECKPVFFQKIKEGVTVGATMHYAGFWVRFVAKIIDNLIVGVVNFAFGFAIGMMTSVGPEEVQAVGLFANYILGFVLACAYTAYFLGRFQATPGKMALGLQVARSDGSRITYARGAGRYFAEILSGCPTLFIGYIWAAFDDQKRTLHDFIVDTRVIHRP